MGPGDRWERERSRGHREHQGDAPANRHVSARLPDRPTSPAAATTRASTPSARATIATVKSRIDWPTRVPAHPPIAPGEVLRHFTVAVFVVHAGRVLLHYHRKLGRWLPPGGHIEDNELPDDAARREVLEETGVHIRLTGPRGLPVVIHCREAEADVVRMLRADYDCHGPVAGVMHSFTGDLATAEACLAMGLHISFAGMLTHYRTKIFGHCVIYFARITGSLTLTVP